MFFKSVFTDESDFYPDFNLYVKYSIEHAGPILEKKYACDFSEKGPKERGQKMTKYLKIWAKMYRTSKYFEKRQLHACNYCMHETARICPDIVVYPRVVNLGQYCRTTFRILRFNLVFTSQKR